MTVAELKQQFVDYLYSMDKNKMSMMEFENNFNFRINKFLSGKLCVYPHFDDSRAKDEDHGYWRFKENLSFGFVYSF